MNKKNIHQLLIRFLLADDLSLATEALYHIAKSSDECQSKIDKNYESVLSATRLVEESFNDILELGNYHPTENLGPTEREKKDDFPQSKSDLMISTIIDQSKGRSYCYLPASLNISRIRNCDLWCESCELTDCPYKHSITV